MYKNMRHYKSQSGQVGRIFRKGSFWDRLLHTVGSFVPFVGSVVAATDNVGSDNGWFAPKETPTPADELNYARTKQQISGIKNKYKTPTVF